jgi:ABC-type glutathione transport system ATPase component/ABC-type dipeptide/oligopeptide/nickel transport system permease subunit
LWDNPKSRAGLILVVAYFVVAIVGRWVTGDPLDYVGVPLEPPSTDFWFGTTGQGQSVLAQTVHGALPTLLVGFSAGALVIALGSIIGGLAGYFGGWIDSMLSLLINVFLLLPGLPLMVVIAAWLPPGPVTLVVVLGLTGWAWNARVVRAQVATMREREFVLASQLLGRSHLVILCTEILPTMASLLLSAFIGATIYAIGAQVGLEFLGLGDIGKVTWGTNLYWASNDAALLTGSWWTFVPTGVCIAMLGFALTLISFGMDEITNPRLLSTRRWRTVVGEDASEAYTPVRLSESSPVAVVPDDSVLLSIQDLKVAFVGQQEEVVAVKGVSFDIKQGEIVGLVGESGCGKSTILQTILRSLPPPAVVRGGRIQWGNQNLFELSEQQGMAQRWTEMALVVQSALTSLNPVQTIASHFQDTLDAHPEHAMENPDAWIQELLGWMDLEIDVLGKYPHELSGGMRQRVVIALALLFKPKLLLFDEPTTALDVLVEQEILAQITKLQQELGFSALFISHDLSLVRQFVDRVVIMKDGVLIESCDTEHLVAAKHPYTQQLLTDQRIEGVEPAPSMPEVVTQCTSLSKIYQSIWSAPTKAVESCTFAIRRSGSIALVGGSGSGKSTIAKMVAGLISITEGTLNGTLPTQSGWLTRRSPSPVQMIFQNPFAALNPTRTVRQHLEHVDVSGVSETEMIAILTQVGLDPESTLAKYPHELSGGQRQRVSIARAVLSKPTVLIADEPTSMLDVSLRSDILQLLRDLQVHHQMALLLITHDMAVAKALTEEIIVLEKGVVVESGNTLDIFSNPQHPYTQQLLRASHSLEAS